MSGTLRCPCTALPAAHTCSGAALVSCRHCRYYRASKLHMQTADTTEMYPPGEPVGQPRSQPVSSAHVLLLHLLREAAGTGAYCHTAGPPLTASQLCPPPSPPFCLQASWSSCGLSRASRSSRRCGTQCGSTPQVSAAMHCMQHCESSAVVMGCCSGCLSACLHACMPACLHACMPACLPLPAAVRTSPMPRLPALPHLLPVVTFFPALLARFLSFFPLPHPIVLQPSSQKASSSPPP